MFQVEIFWTVTPCSVVKGNQQVGNNWVYSIPCECRKVYIGQTGRSFKTTINKHHRLIRLYRPDKSVVAKHSIDIGHGIQFQNTRILATKMDTWNASGRHQISNHIPMT
jgi:hypothetical protein